MPEPARKGSHTQCRSGTRQHHGARHQSAHRQLCLRRPQTPNMSGCRWSSSQPPNDTKSAGRICSFVGDSDVRRVSHFAGAPGNSDTREVLSAGRAGHLLAPGLAPRKRLLSGTDRVRDLLERPDLRGLPRRTRLGGHDGLAVMQELNDHFSRSQYGSELGKRGA